MARINKKNNFNLLKINSLNKHKVAPTAPLNSILIHNQNRPKHSIKASFEAFFYLNIS